MLTSLTGVWQLAAAGGDYALPMSIPGDGISASQQAGHIPDLYAGRNQYALRCIALRDEEQWVLTVSTQVLALSVTIESSIPGRFCDNASSLLPEYPATIILTPDNTPGLSPQSALRDLLFLPIIR